MRGKHIIVLTTYAREKTGAKIIGALLEAKRAACVQSLPVRSVYRWKGSVMKDREHLMLIKARATDFRAIREIILNNHDYDLPEVVSVRIDQGSARYLDWIDRVTQR